jgi:hypothetical protein
MSPTNLGTHKIFNFDWKTPKENIITPEKIFPMMYQALQLELI